MTTKKCLKTLLQKSKTLPFDDKDRLVCMSDLHRGSGTWNDNFLKNQNLFFAALTHYYHNDFTYIELGDGDELWENRSFQSIVCMHSDAFWLMSELYKEGRFYMLYGNHDMVKREPSFRLYECSSFFNEEKQRKTPLFPGIEILEALQLYYVPTDRKILLLHGHQGDFLNDTLWKLSRFLVRYVWRPLEFIGFHDPTSAAKNYALKEHTEKKLLHFCESTDTMVITGHTHRPVFPKPGSSLYFNDGSGIHPRCITAIELERGCITLVKWSVQTDENLKLYVGRTILEGPVPLRLYQ